MQNLPKVVLIVAVLAFVGSGVFHITQRGVPWQGAKKEPEAKPISRPTVVDPVKEVFESTAKDVDELILNGDFGDALAAWDAFPSEHLQGQWIKRVEEERRKVLERAKNEARSQVNQAKVSAKAGDYAKAAEMLSALDAWGIPEISAEVEAARSGVVQDLFRRLSTEVQKLVKAQKFGEAVAKLDEFPETFLTLDWKRRLEDERRQVNQAARTEFARLSTQAEKLREAGRTKEAEEMLRQKADEFGLPMIKTLLREQLVQWEEKAKLEVEVSYQKLLSENVRPKVAKRDLAEAEKALREAKENPQYQWILPRIEKETEIVQRIARLIDKAREGAPKLVGQETIIDGVAVTVVGADGDMIIVQPARSDVKMPKSIARLSTNSLLALAEAAYGDDRGAFHLDAALLLSYTGDVGAMQTQLGLAQQAGADLRPYEEHFAAQQIDPMEGAAASLFEKATRAHQQKDWPSAEIYLSLLLKEYQRTGFVQQMKEILYDSLVEARQRGLSVASLFPNAEVSEQNGQVTLRYDFSRTAQLEDWKQPEKSPWRISDGAITSERQQVEGRSLLWYKLPLPGDKTLEFDAAVDAKARDIGAVLDGNGQDSQVTFSGYQVYFGGFDRTYTGIQRLEEDSTLKLSFVPQPNRTYRIKVARAGSTIQLHVDGELVDTLEDREPLTGPDNQYVALYASTRNPFRADNVTLTCTLPPDWVSQQLDVMRKALAFDLRLANGERVAIFDGHTLDGWSIQQGVWYTMNDAILAEGELDEMQKAVMLYGSESWKNYVLTAKVFIEEGSVAGLIARDSAGKRCLAYVSTRNRVVVTSGGKTIDQPAETRLGRWYELRLQVKGSRIEFAADDIALPVLQDTASKEGRPGLYFSGRKGLFRDVFLQLLEEE